MCLFRGTAAGNEMQKGKSDWWRFKFNSRGWLIQCPIFFLSSSSTLPWCTSLLPLSFYKLETTQILYYQPQQIKISSATTIITSLWRSVFRTLQKTVSLKLFCFSLFQNFLSRMWKAWVLYHCVRVFLLSWYTFDHLYGLVYFSYPISNILHRGNKKKKTCKWKYVSISSAVLDPVQL